MVEQERSEGPADNRSATMTSAERNGSLWAGLVGAVLGYLFFVAGDVSVGSVLAAAVLTVAAAAIGYYLVRGQRTRG